MEYNIYKDGELYHWGIPGMKWGVRRYQNKDGSLTAAGKKRRDKLENDLKAREKVIKKRENAQLKATQLAAKKKELDEREEALNSGKRVVKESPKKKTVKEMTDDELREVTNRMQLEKNYYDAQKNLAAANPPKIPAGKRFMQGLIKDVITPAATNAGKAWAENFMKEKLGLNKEDPLKKLENKFKKLEWEKKIKDIQKDPEGDDDLVKALEFFRNTTKEDRDELKDAASMFENMDKIRKKGKTKD